MRKLLLALALVATIASGCGTPGPGSGSVDSTTPTSTATTTTTTNTPDDSQAGFGSPSPTEGEFEIEGIALPVHGQLELDEKGCWYVDIAGSAYLVVFPVGFTIPFSDDPTVIKDPAGSVYASGDLVDGTAHQLQLGSVPGGDAGRWGNYIAFCDPETGSLAVFTTMEPAFDAEALGAEGAARLVIDAEFTESWSCGRGWAVSTSDQLVAIFIYQQSETTVGIDTTITLPDPAWSAEVVVGKHLFVNHCDDVFEEWEPLPVVAARWQLAGGTLRLIDEVPEGFESAPVRATLIGASITGDDGTTISLPQIDLVNKAFNFFAG